MDDYQFRYAVHFMRTNDTFLCTLSFLVHPAFPWVMVQLLGKAPPAMQDKELYQHILGLTSPWTVSEVKLDMEAQEIQLRVEHPTGTKFCCPECQKELSCYVHGVKSVSVPWALPHSRFTIMFERFAIEVMLMTQTVKGAMTILRLQWDATWHIIERAVARGKARKEPSLLPRIGIDEKAFAKGRGRAWSYKELLRDLWTQETAGKAKSYFGDWYQRVIRTKMAPKKKLARSLRERIDNIVTYCTQ